MPREIYDEELAPEFDPAIEEEAVELMRDNPAFADFGEFADLAKERAALKTRLKAVEEAMKRREARLMSHFQQMGQRSFKINGATIFMHGAIHPALKKGLMAFEGLRALRESGLSHYIFETFNKQSLGKYIREIRDEHAEELRSGAVESIGALLPPAMAKVFDVETSWRVQGRPSRKA